MECWNNFNGIKWKQSIDVEDFIINNYQEYVGSSDFLKGITKKTSRLYGRFQKLLDKSNDSGFLDIETSYFSGIDIFDNGYVDKKNEVIVGLQTDDPLKVCVNPYVSLESSLKKIKNLGYRFDKESKEQFEEYLKSYESMIDDTYTSEIKKYKELKLIGGLPDTFGRGFIVGDYRRIALYGIDYLIAKKRNDLERLKKDINYSIVRTREEVVKQIDSLNKLKNMASHYGYDISKPAKNAKEAIQWIYFGYLGAVKENNGCVVPLGNNSTFIDIYINRDLELGLLTEEGAQELIDQFIIKLRMVRFLREDDYYEYFPGKNPIITETLGGIYNNKSFITKTTYRFLNTLENIDEYPCPNFVVLWSKYLPNNFKRYCAKVMLKYNVLSFVNADIIQNSNICITSGASFNKLGKQIDYYGGSCNLPKILLYAINGGVDELTKEKVIDGVEPILGDTLNYADVVKNFSICLNKVISIHADALNIIHYLHDKYAYESSIMALNDTVVERNITFDLVGVSTLVDSLSAIRYSTVKVNRDENGLALEYVSDNSYPRYGNNKDEVDKLVVDIIKLYSKLLQQYHFYRNSKIKIGTNTYSSNVLYGNNTGATPDGRFKGVPFSVGVNPVNSVDNNGVLETLKSVLKIPSSMCNGGLIETININHSALGSKRSERAENIINLIDSFMLQGGEHLEFNIIDNSVLLDAANGSNKYDKLVIKNSGVSFLFSDLTDKQQNDIIDRTFHRSL